jgi:hypothetical protein
MVSIAFSDWKSPKFSACIYELVMNDEDGSNPFSIDLCRISSTTNYAENLPQLFPV